MENKPTNNQDVFSQNIFDSEKSTKLESEAKTAKNPWVQRVIGVAIVCSFFIVQYIAGIIMLVAMFSHNAMGELSLDVVLSDMFLGMLIAEVIAILILIAIYNKKIWLKIKEALSSFLIFSIKISVYFGLLWVALVVFGIVDTLLFPGLIEEAGNNQDLIESALITPSPAMIISICITAPIIEEFAFRYGIISKLLYGVNKYVAAVIAALIFSFVHIGFEQITSLALFIHLMLGYMGAALVFGFIYVREDNLLYSIIIHMLNNIMAVVLILSYMSL